MIYSHPLIFFGSSFFSGVCFSMFSWQGLASEWRPVVRGEGFFFFTIRNWITSKFTLTNSWWSIRCCFFLNMCSANVMMIPLMWYTWGITRLKRHFAPWRVCVGKLGGLWKCVCFSVSLFFFPTFLKHIFLRS